MAIWRSLSGRLLVLTVVFVMIAEILIFVPSVARYRADYLTDRLDRGQLAGLAKLAAGGMSIDPDLEAELLRNANVYSVVLRRDQTRQLMLMSPDKHMIEETFDLRDVGPLTLIRDAILCAIGPDRRFIRVIGAPRLAGGEQVEVVVDEGPLRQAMLDYGVRIFWLSLVISVITAGLVFVSVNFFVVRPTLRVVQSVASFREDPTDPDREIQTSGTGGVIGLAEKELAAMQTELRGALRQKSRLAAVGEAVAKINHDLRNILASAQLLADRLETSKDPMVSRIGPKLIGSLDRAIRLCQRTLDYGRADEPPPEKTDVPLAPLFREIGDALGLGVEARPALAIEVDATLTASADPDQLFRAVLNLSRNAVEAMDAMAAEGAGPGRLALSAVATAVGGVAIDVADTGPGLPEKARENLFKPFQGSVRKGGSGLGLAIARELAQGHGGALELVESSDDGARFRLTLPPGRGV